MSVESQSGRGVNQGKMIFVMCADKSLLLTMCVSELWICDYVE